MFIILKYVHNDGDILATDRLINLEFFLMKIIFELYSHTHTHFSK